MNYSIDVRVFKLVIFISVLSTVNFSDAYSDDLNNNVSDIPKKYYVHDIKKAMMDYIRENVDENNIFHLKDEKTGENLSLKFVEIHDPVRVINSNTYFACTDFHVKGDPKKLYDLDFWMSPVDGVLKIYKTKIHKEPRKSLIYGWYKQPRYTFIDDEIVYIY